jgi:hypothetical protein
MFYHAKICADWGSRVYFSDNGSTAIEIALKMAFRKFSVDHGLILDCHEDATTERSTELMVGTHGPLFSLFYFIAYSSILI